MMTRNDSVALGALWLTLVAFVLGVGFGFLLGC